ncbi:MAG: OmpA family protein [Bacteroidales bacterium]
MENSIIQGVFMFKKLIFNLTLAIFVLFGFTPVYAQQDVEGSEDHPMISRYEGAYINGYEQFDYARLTFFTGEEDGELQKIEPEGEATRILYFLPEGLSVLQVQRNYQRALKDAGFEIVYEGFGGFEEIPREIYRDFDMIGGRKNDNVFLSGEDASYFLAKLPQENGDVYVSSHTLLSGHADFDNQVVTALQILEEKPMETGKVKVEIDAETMANDIDDKGSVRIYGIYFDTDKATIKKKSESTLAEIASLLDEKPELNLGVVGHTDATGSEEHNMDLSKQRAEAVVEFLASEHRISEERLIPKGVGPWAPVASNDDEDGRAQNRRVELVEIVDE